MKTIVSPFLTFLIFLLGFLPSSAFTQDQPFDYVIKGALVFDGDSLVPVKRDLAIFEDRIVQISPEIPKEEAREVIEAQGLVLSPGFIDVHTHSDFNPFIYANLGNKVLQGVTTEVIGNCGMSAAPIEGRHAGEIADVWKREGVEIPPAIPWKNFREYRSDAEFQGLETNFVSLVGHGNLRSAVMGMETRPARPEELESMRKLLDEALEQGAFGISFGLTYLPGIFATREELVSLCREAAEQDGICAFHVRSESEDLTESIREAIEVARASGARLHISHLKAAGKKNWPKIKEALQEIEGARMQGLNVTADAYPYTASFAELGVILPDEIFQDPGRIRRFKDPVHREALIKILADRYRKNPVAWDQIRIATVTSEKNLPFQGKSLHEIAKESGRSPEGVLVDLLAEEEFKVSAFYFSQNEDVVDEVLSKPYVAVGSDSIADGSGSPHPRAYGTFPRRLAQCPKGKPVTSSSCWGHVIHQMTRVPAEIFGLRKRGQIGVGMYADLVLFDPERVGDRADYQNPKTPPVGIEWVFVNGRPVVQEGRYEPIHSGLFLAPE